MATQSSQLLPTIRLRDLPVFTGTVGETDSVLLISRNGVERRLPVSALLSSLENNITSEDVVPSDPLNAGRDGQIAWDETGIYTYYNGVWGKSPKYNAFWADITETVRFLLVSKDQELSDDEKKIGRDNLGISSATTTAEGIVRLANSISEGLATVPTAGVVAEYVKQQLGNHSIPTATSIDPPSEGYTTAKLVYDYVSRISLGNATTTTAGVVKLATSIVQNGTGVPTAAQVYAFVKENAGSVSQATTSIYGTVRLATDISLSNPYVPTSGTVYSYIQTQLSNINVANAGIDKRGTVVLTSNFPDNPAPSATEVPTQYAIAQFVNRAIEKAIQNIPTPAPSSGGGSGLVDLSNYQGAIHLRGKDGKTILQYDESSSTLYIGKSVCTVVLQPNHKVEVRNKTGGVESEFVTGLDCSGTPLPTMPEYPSPDDPQSTPTPTPSTEPSPTPEPSTDPSPTPEPSTDPSPTPEPSNPDNSPTPSNELGDAWGWNSNLRVPTITVTNGDTVIEGDLFIIGSAVITGSLIRNASLTNS